MFLVEWTLTFFRRLCPLPMYPIEPSLTMISKMDYICFIGTLVSSPFISLSNGRLLERARVVELDYLESPSSIGHLNSLCESLFEMSRINQHFILCCYYFFQEIAFD